MPDIESTIEETGPIVRNLKVTVAGGRIAAEFDAAFQKLRSSVQLKGFRKGKVPRDILEKHYGEEVQRDVIGSTIESACAEVLREHEFDIVAPPRLLSHDYDEEKGLTFEVRVELRPEFELAEYKGLEGVRRTVRVEEHHVDAAIQALRERMAVLETEEDRVNVEPGDVVVFDMYGFSEGAPVAGTSGEGVQLELGAGRFPEEFEKQMVGVTRAIKTPITVSFPDDHGDENVAGKTVRFDVTVREIKKKVLPDLDEEFVNELGFEDCESMEDVRGRVRRDLQERASLDADRRMRGALIEGLVDAHHFDVPETLVEEAIHARLREIGAEEAPEDKMRELHDALEPGARKQVRAGFVLDAVVRAEDVEVSKEDVEERVRQQLAMAGPRADEVRKHYSTREAVGELAATVAREKAVTKVVELSTVSDVEIDETEVADHPQSG